jgi:hypothetical protein
MARHCECWPTLWDRKRGQWQLTKNAWTASLEHCSGRCVASGSSGRCSNRRLVACDDRGVTFRWKDYRAQSRTRYKTMTLMTDEFMRRFLLHVLPSGFHRIRHCGLLANANRKTHIATARELLHQPSPVLPANSGVGGTASSCVRPTFVCRHCGAPMLIIETFARAQHIRGPLASPSPP